MKNILSNLNKYISITLLCFLSSTYVQASNSQMWPGSQYHDSIPTYSQVLGYQIGERISSYADMLRYFEALAAAAPKRIKIHEYARSWENRKLIYISIGSEINLSSLDVFAQHMSQLSDPRVTDKARAQKLINTMPSSVWLSYGVHGNEISSTDAAMMTAYHLLAALNDPITKKILENTLVFIDPLQNPDGRMRFVNRYYETVGLADDGDRLNAEHNEPWPQGRSNHYLFDMNRDWLALTQPESKGRVKALNKYHPLVVIDLHEMGGDSSYYFAPPAQPLNPHMTQSQIDNITRVGLNNAKHFDAFGFDYFTREVFDAFYPGYGDSWPVFYGAAASTYEVGSARGERFRTKSGKLLSYRDTINKHFIASISTAESVADNRHKLLSDYYDYQVSAIKQGKSSAQRYTIMPNTRDQAGTFRLASLLLEHGIEVKQAEQKFRACNKNYSAGAYIIDSAQPRGRFIKTVMDKQVNMSAAFLKEQERRRSVKLNDEIYDVTAWSLPLMFNIDTDSCKAGIKVTTRDVKIDHQLLGKVNNPDASVAYLIPWGDMAAGRFLTTALRAGINIKSSDKAFTLANKTKYPAGTLIVEVKANDNKLLKHIQTIAAETGAQVDGVNSSWVIEGPSFGSGNVVQMTAPRIAMAWDEPVSSLSAGNTRFVIEQQFNYPVTAIRTRTLKRANLSHYQVLILASGNYQNSLDKKAIKNIKNWINNGGVLLTLGSATQFVADVEVGLLDVKRELAYKSDLKKSSKTDPKDKKSTTKGQLYQDDKDFIAAIENNEEKPDYVPGVLLNVDIDQEHWLTAGVHKNVVAMVTGSQIYTPIKLASGKNVARFTNKDDLLASGYLWQQNRLQLAYKPYLIYQPMGTGMIISYTQEPTYRAYLDGLNVLFLNSIFRSAAHSRQLKQ
jgi:hypothetical protein